MSAVGRIRAAGIGVGLIAALDVVRDGSVCFRGSICVRGN
jgi:hypothetical protein